MSVLLYCCTTMTLTNRMRKKKTNVYNTRMLSAVLVIPRSSALQNISCTSTYLPSHKPSKWDEQDIQGSTEEIRTNSWGQTLHWIFPVHQLCVDTGCRNGDLPRARADKDRWRERVEETRVISAHLDDDDDDDDILYFPFFTIIWQSSVLKYFTNGTIV